jgi:biopolymer transport protein ExbD
MSRRKHRIGGTGGHDEELMITPLLDLFVALIPFLIMSVVMTKINIIEVGISKPVTAVSKSPEKFDLLLKVSDSNVEVTLNGKVVKTVSKGVADDKVWVSSVRSVLIDIKRQHLDEYKIRIEPKGKVTLHTLMSFMDGARKILPTDGEFIKRDEKGQAVKLQFLFPNVILRGVYS